MSQWLVCMSVGKIRQYVVCVIALQRSPTVLMEGIEDGNGLAAAVAASSAVAVCLQRFSCISSHGLASQLAR